MKFRYLRADEVECRVSTVTKKGCSLLLYKDARCDQNILDECVQPMNWQRHHSRDNANCIVSIWDEDKKMWIEKEDTGTESFTEKEKGLASDSFKRACFNWGIGRELYTAPFIWVSSDKCEIVPHPTQQNKFTTNDRFSVSEMVVEDGKITRLVVVNSKTNAEVYSFGKARKKPVAITVPHVKRITDQCEKTGTNPSIIFAHYGINAITDMTEDQYSDLVANWSAITNGK